MTVLNSTYAEKYECPTHHVINTSEPYEWCNNVTQYRHIEAQHIRPRRSNNKYFGFVSSQQEV